MWKLVALGCVACSASKSPTSTATQAPLANAGATAVIKSSGLFVANKLVLGPDDLRSPDALEAALVGAHPQVVVLDLETAPAAIATSALIALRNSKLEKRRRLADGMERPFTVKSTVPNGDDDQVKLSVEIEAGRVVLGLARVEEYQFLPHASPTSPDMERVRAELEVHKPTAFFYDRTDIEIAVAPELESRALLDMAELVTQIGFTDVEVLPPEELTARVANLPVVDVAGLKPDAIRERLDEHRDQSVAIRAGAGEVCPWIRIVGAPVDDEYDTLRHVVLVRAKAPVWITLDDLDKKSRGRGSFYKKEAAPSDIEREMAGTLKNMLMARRPILLAAEAKVDAATFLTVLGGLCAAGAQNLHVTTVKELPFKP